MRPRLRPRTEDRTRRRYHAVSGRHRAILYGFTQHGHDVDGGLARGSAAELVSTILWLAGRRGRVQET